MNTRTALTALTVVVASLAATAPAFAGAFDHGRTAPVALRNNAEAFIAQTQAQVSQITQQVRSDVGMGRVQARAIPVLNVQRRQIETSLRQASRDGMITGMERYTVNQLVTGLARIDAQYRMMTHGRFGSNYGTYR